MNPWLAAPLGGALALLASLIFFGVTVLGALRIRTHVVALSRHPAAAAVSRLSETGYVLKRAMGQLDQAKMHVVEFGDDVATIAAAYASARILIRKTLAMVADLRELFNV